MLSEYLQVVLGVSVFVSVALGICHTRARAVTVFASGVIVICVIMLPLVDILRGFDVDDILEDMLGDIDYDTASDGSIELAFEEGISRYISEKYGVDEETVTVSADGFDLATLKARRIYVTLSGKASLLDYKRIELDIATEFTDGGECEVSINIG